MGPIGFALGLEATLDKCRTQEDAFPWAARYLDDGTIVGTLEGVSAYATALIPALHAVGLQVNLTKCLLWGPGIRREEDMDDAIPEEWPLDHPFRTILSVPYVKSQGITVLGSYVTQNTLPNMRTITGRKRLTRRWKHWPNSGNSRMAKYGIACCGTA